jgi:hypothetical protein
VLRLQTAGADRYGIPEAAVSRFIDLLLMSPPAIDAPSFVGVQDEYGTGVELGQWIAPDDTCLFWRYRLDPAELLSYMIKGSEARPSRTPAPTIAAAPHAAPAPPNAGVSGRNALRARLANAKPRSADAPPTTAGAPQPSPAVAQKCPACHVPFDPTRHELIACSGCGEDKCSARCIPNAAAPCLDCAALTADPDEGGFDAGAGPPAAVVKTPGLKEKMAKESSGATQAVAGRLFDDEFHGKGGTSTEDNDDE